VFRFPDQWQAGLCGEVLVFPDEAKYRRNVEDILVDLRSDE